MPGIDNLKTRTEAISMETSKKFRLLTRSDLDGLVCAALMKYLDKVNEIVLIDSPSVMQSGEMKVLPDDIITNLPYVPGVYMAFDHHFSESLRNKENPRHIIDPDAPSAARVIYEHFGGENRFPDFFDDVMAAVDIADSGRFTRQEILCPTRWALLNFLVDKRTGIEDWGKFALDELQFKRHLIDWILEKTIDEIMALPDVAQRADIYFQYEKLYKQQIASAAKIFDNVVVLDFRDSGRIFPGNRFLIYASYPRCNLSIQVKREPDKHTTTFSVGKSIINTTSGANIGELMLQYGGGGHRAAGACHVDDADADHVLEKILEKLREPEAVTFY